MRRKIFKPHKPNSTNGNLYYVRLKTDLGILYKVGFTKLKSAEERLNYENKSNNYTIDKILFFHYYEEAWHIEQKIHHHFKRDSLFSGLDDRMPLYKNGQSELYAKDILNIDPEYNELHTEDVLVNIQIIDLMSSNSTKDSVMLAEQNMRQKFKKLRDQKKQDIEYGQYLKDNHPIKVRIFSVILVSFVSVIFGFFNIFKKLIGDKFGIFSNDEISKILTDIREKYNEQRDQERVLRQARLNDMLKLEKLLSNSHTEKSK